jgi:hypothetical protein
VGGGTAVSQIVVRKLEVEKPFGCENEDVRILQ